MDQVRTVFFVWAGMLALGCATARAASNDRIDNAERSARYRTRYPLRDTSEKLVDNQGNGRESLYGTRNFRAVLPGVLYRGGANNSYHRDHPRGNQNPLPNDGLTNLCEEGFANAIYLYSENFGSAPKDTACARGGALHYQSWSPHEDAPLRSSLTLIHQTIQDPSRGPVYAHCWNGWHASGLLSAISLRQFCGVSGADAVAYWNRNVDGNNSSKYESIRNRIRNFKVIPELAIGADAQKAICPNFNGEFVN
jgi:hypothetical protein